jgi:hypothetical protein
VSQVSDLAGGGAGVEAAAYLELKIELTGRFVPGEPARGPSFSSGGEPPWDDSAEDIQIDGLFAHGGVDLLAGVERTPPVRRLLDNLLEALGTDAVDAIVEAAQ